MFSIGETSQITGLTVKTLRFYHEKGLLTPAYVDHQTGYRFYAERQIAKARVIAKLRRLEFSLQQIGDMLAGSDDEADLLVFLERQRTLLDKKARDYRDLVDSLDRFIKHQREEKIVSRDVLFEVEEKTVEPVLVAAVRMKGKYADCCNGFARIGKALGRRIAGKPFLLQYDLEYKEDDADFEACMPIRAGKPVDGVAVRELPGGRCIALMHKGPYEELGRSYEKLWTYIKARGCSIAIPTREIYLKGPGMIFRGDPKNYLTELQMLIADQPASTACGAP